MTNVAREPMQQTDVAIIGLACRFPAAANPRDFWRLIRDGLEVTQLRRNVAEFDADFFNLSPREACAMDPRQRLALELTWELLEDAYVVPETIRGEQVSIYLGAMTDDYAFLTLRDADNLDHHSFAGISRGMIANRISYAFGLHGSSMTVDSGQSSSLVAVHLACESLHTGESPLAIAGGIHLNLANETAMLEAEFGAVSTTGHTYAFDERADGYVRGEGGGLVLLKPLRAALDDGNRIRAVIRGSAVGNAGHSAGGQIVPSISGQTDVIRRGLSSAGLGSSDVQYIEAHGTGTEIGDPVEARALGEIFAERQHRPVSMGSVKTNIGHAGSASGIAGLIKTVLAIENAMIPASLNYARANPQIDLETLGLRVNTTLTPWPTEGGPRRAGVSSFGMGGTNAHVIVEQAPAEVESLVAERDDTEPVVAWVLSARSAEALANQAGRLSAHVAGDAGLGVADVGWSLVTTRSVFEHRAVLVGADREHLTGGLAALAAGEPGAGVVVGRARSVGKTVFVFSGEGSQWLGMGQQLYERFPVFATAFDEATAALDRHLRVPLRQVIWGDDADLLQSTEFAQPALFAVEVGLAALWQHWGVVPDLVMGHSVGEISAAYVAGVLTLDDAARVVAGRDWLMAGLPSDGVLAGVSAGQPRIGLVSNVTGQLAESLGASVFVEVGPGAGLTASVVTMPKDRPEIESLLTAAGRLFTTGVRVDWRVVLGGLAARRADLPTYGFVRQQFWLEMIRDALAERLQGLAPKEQHRQLVELVCLHAANVLGRSSSTDIDAERAFSDLGFDALTGVELRNRLKTDTGLALARTLIFDYPTPTALADHLAQKLLRGYHDKSGDEKIWSALRKIPLQELRKTGLLDKLLLLAGMPEKSLPDPTVSDDVIDSLSPDALIAMTLSPADDDDLEGRNPRWRA
jgi:acyl transferase domain-containing protein